METPAFFFLMMILLCLVIQGFFSMVEMAAVSFNKVRLQYYVSQKDRRALWLNYLLHRPALLFGTTLIGVNTALIVGSECARRFYGAIGLSPDWAPLSQVIIVIVFAEVAPLFAGRRYAEHVAMLGIPLLFLCSIILRPIIWGLDLICRLIMRCVGKPNSAGMYLSREELQNMISSGEEGIPSHQVVSNIFSLKNKQAKDLMEPLSQVRILPSFCTVGELRALIKVKSAHFFPIYHRELQHIIGVAYPRDLLRLSDNKKIKDYARQPWFITEGTSIIHLLKQFRKNNQSLAVVLNEKGMATGILTLDEVIDEIFGRTDEWMSYEDILPRAYHVVIDRSFPSDMSLESLNKQFQVHLSFQTATTLEEAMCQALGHTPATGESVRIDQFELTALHSSLLGPTQIQVRTLF